MMNIGRDFHMAKGVGESSYAKNSRRQVIVTSETKPVIEKATKEVYAALLPRTMVVADLGCSSGPNTLLFISNVINAIADHYTKLGQNDPIELQFFLNDLPGNDFNQLFMSLENFRRSVARDCKEDKLPPYYISGLPNSYYIRLFPGQSVHLFHSSYCLHWRSQVPEGLESKREEAYLNEDNMYITKTTSSTVVKLFHEQFEKDFSLFLKLRHEELVFGGQMVLTFLGRKNENVYSGDLNHLFGLLAQSLKSLVVEGLVEKEELDSFNLPVYGPSIGEVKAILKQSDMFDVDHIKLFEQNWDPYDDSEGDVVHDSACSSVNIVKCIRSVVESLVTKQFGESILDKLFEEYTRRVANHLEKEKTKFSVIVLSLKKK